MRFDLKEIEPIIGELIGEKIDRITIYKKKIVLRINHLSDSFPQYRKSRIICFVPDDTSYDIYFNYLNYQPNQKLDGICLYKEEFLSDSFSSFRNAPITIEEAVYTSQNVIIIGTSKTKKDNIEYKIEIIINYVSINCEFDEAIGNLGKR